MSLAPPETLVEEPAPVTYYYGVPDALFEVMLHEPPEGIRRIPEALVQALWHQQRFDRSALRTTAGEVITILEPGTLNRDGGPDFRNAHLRIGGTTWRGDVEIHVSSRTWFDHDHHEDARYNSVILHVSLHGDLWTGGLLRPDGTRLPEVVLYPHLEASLRELLFQFYTTPTDELLCAARWPTVPDAVRQPYLLELAHERMRAKTQRLARSQADHLDDVLHQRLFAALGYAKNTEPMQELARRVPLSLLRPLNDPLEVEALLFGVAGLLPEPADLLDADRATADYAMDLRERFDRLRHRLDVTPMRGVVWQFFRLRPANFPTLRIAQAARFVGPGGLLRQDPLVALLDAARQPRPIDALFRVLRVQPGAFWETHFRLEKATKPRKPALGKSRLRALLVNAVVPVLLLHAEQTGQPDLEAQVFALLTHLPPENDEVMRRFKALGTTPSDALAAQGLHQLYRTRCSEAHCLSCKIGQHLLQDSEHVAG